MSNLWLIAGAIPNFAIAAAAFIIPHFFSKYQQVWDSRIKRNRESRSTAAETVGGYLMQFKRTHYEIYWEILTYCKTPRSFTSIINRCNLNSKIGQVHLDFLKNRRFLAEVQDEGMTLLKATEAAKEYIALFNKTYRELFDDSAQNSEYTELSVRASYVTINAFVQHAFRLRQSFSGHISTQRKHNIHIDVSTGPVFFS